MESGDKRKDDRRVRAALVPLKSSEMSSPRPPETSPPGNQPDPLLPSREEAVGRDTGAPCGEDLEFISPRPAPRPSPRHTTPAHREPAFQSTAWNYVQCFPFPPLLCLPESLALPSCPNLFLYLHLVLLPVLVSLLPSEAIDDIRNVEVKGMSLGPSH